MNSIFRFSSHKLLPQKPGLPEAGRSKGTPTPPGESEKNNSRFLHGGGFFYSPEGRRATIRLMLGDCLERMKEIDAGSVDMVLTDPPYGTTACKWDSVIPFEPMWAELKRIIKPNGAIALFGNEPFTSTLICSNLKGFKYRLDWDKKIPSGVSYARFRPMQQTEDICIFTGNGEKSNYYPQKVKRDKPIKSGGMGKSDSAMTKTYVPLNKTYTIKTP